MVWPFSPRRFSFLGKLFALACGITVVGVSLIALALWIVNHEFTNRYEREVQQMLGTAEAVFNHTRDARLRNLRLRSQQASNEPRIRALTQTDAATVENVLREDLIGEESIASTVDAISFANATGQILSSSASDKTLKLADLEAAILPIIKQALAENDTQDATVLIGGRMFDVVANPIIFRGQAAGVLSFAAENGTAVAREFKKLTRSEIAFVANDRVVASTMEDTNLYSRLAGMFSQSLVPSARSSLRPIQLNGEHFLGIAGKFEGVEPPQVFGYLLLFSYEEALAGLRDMRQSLLVIGVMGALLSTLLAWFVVHRMTEPLRQLRGGAEAVERGDLSVQIPISSHDEFGELAFTFNRMTTSLKSSREELERTVETLRTTQTQLVQKEKLSAIGQFVAGVAHELNNPLTSVIGYADLLKASHLSEADRECAEQVLQNADRCAKIVRNLLNFARQSPPTRRPVQINAVIEETLRLFSSALRTGDVRVTRSFESNLPEVMADAPQVQQVFFNIINNAIQAIQLSPGKGSLQIATESSSGEIKAIFTDNGPGISQKSLSKLFTPFFTTKEVGQGIGLGLSVSYGIIKEHGGDITVQSEAGQGATFIVELPVSTDPTQPAGATKGSDETNELTLPRCERNVLVVDDELSIGNLVGRFLNPLGFRIEHAHTAEAALAMLHGRSFEVVLCDCKMPGIGGMKFYEKVRVSHPEIASRFVFITGDIFSRETRDFMQKYDLIHLPKPFSAEELSTAIKKLPE